MSCGGLGCRNSKDAGRLRTNLLRLPNGDLALTLIVGVNTQKGELARYGRGCEAILSYDNGLTWHVGHKYVLDEVQFYNGIDWTVATSGHLYSTLLDDGHIQTCYGKCVFNIGHHPYPDMGGCLIKRVTPCMREKRGGVA